MLKKRKTIQTSFFLSLKVYKNMQEKIEITYDPRLQIITNNTFFEIHLILYAKLYNYTHFPTNTIYFVFS